MLNPRGWRPVVAVELRSVANLIVLALIALFVVYVLVGALSIYASIFVFAASPIWIWIPLAYGFGWSIVNRPAAGMLLVALFLAACVALAWALGLGDQLKHASVPGSNFRHYTFPAIAWGLSFFVVWLGTSVVLHYRSRPYLAAWWLIVPLTLILCGAWIWLNKPFLGFAVTGWNAALHRDDAAAKVADKQCDRANSPTEIRDPKVYDICKRDGHLPPMGGRVLPFESKYFLPAGSTPTP